MAIFLYKFAISDKNKVIFHNLEDKKIFIKERISKSFNSFVVLGSGVDTSHFKFSKLSKKKYLSFCRETFMEQRDNAIYRSFKLF